MVASSARYDVFLCYNNLEKQPVSWLGEKLKGEGLRVFLDDRVLVAGTSLPTEISSALTDSLSCAVVLGPSGVGKWQKFEVDIAIEQSIADSAFRVIVLMLAGANANEIPPSLRHLLHVDFSAGLDDSEAFRRLLDGIQGSSSYTGDSADSPIDLPYRSMAPRSEGFVLRPELEAVMAALTREPEEGAHVPTAVALTTALRGAGGFGKTALAQVVCEQEATRKRFPAGILWATLGQRLTEAQRLARVRDLLRWWTRREPSSYETLESAAAFLRESLSGHRVLLVLDDVWLLADVAPFAGLAAPAALLITTRNTRTLPTATQAVVVDALEVPRAVELLGQGLSPFPPASTLARLAGKLGEWPILLKLVNAQLREEYRAGVSADAALRVVEDALGEMGLTAFDREDEEARDLAVRRTVEASLQRLSSEDRQRYAQLAVFPEDEHIPLAVLELLWEAEEQEVARLCRRLTEMSLLYRFDRVAHWIQLHDVMRAYLLREHRELIQSFHGALVDSYLSQEASQLGRDAESYFVAQLPYHLKESGRELELKNLLFSFPWLEKKLAGSDVNAAMADYELLPGSEEAAAVRECLLLSRSILTEDPSQLASQLHGRLASPRSNRIKNFLEEAAANQARPWLRPLSATLQKPNGPLISTFQAHQGEVRAIAQLDERRFATAGTEGEIHVWDFATGELIASMGAVSPIRHLATVTPNRLLAASDDGIIRLWDLAEEQVIRSFEGHRSPVTALRLRHEEFLSGAEDGILLRWSLDAELPLGSFQGHSSKINGIGYLDSRTMISVGKDRTLRVWNIPSGKQLRNLTLPVFAAEVLEVTASNEVILGTSAGQVQVWKPMSRETKPRRSLMYRSVGMDALRMLERDLGVSTLGGLSGIQLWNPRAACVLGPEIHVPGGGVSALERFGSGHLLCGSKDGRVSVWAIEALRTQTERLPGAVYAVAALDAMTAISASYSGSLNVWNVYEGSLLKTFPAHSESLNSMCVFSPTCVASSSSDSTIRIWNPQTGGLLRTLQCSEKPSSLAALTEEWLVSAPLASLTKDHSCQIWDIARGRKQVDLPAFGGVGALCASDGRFLVIGTFEGLIVHLDISTASVRRNFHLSGHERGVVSLTMIDREHLASGSIDKTIRIWDLSSQRAIQILRGHESEVTGLASLSSRFLASASQDQTIKVWDIETGTSVVNFQMDIGLSSLAVMPDCRTLVAGDAAGTVHFLRLEGLTK